MWRAESLLQQALSLLNQQLGQAGDKQGVIVQAWESLGVEIQRSVLPLRGITPFECLLPLVLQQGWTTTKSVGKQRCY